MNYSFTKKTRNRMIAAAVAGCILIIADIAAAVSGSGSQIVRNDSRLFLVRPTEGEKAQRIVLEAQIQYDDDEFKRKYDLSLEPFSSQTEEENAPEESMSSREMIENEMRTAMGALNSDLSLKKVELPTKLKSGEKVHWYRKKQTHTMIICVLILGALIAIWQNEGASRKKEMEQRRNSVMRQLPEFINRLVLLMNAGLVLNTAFEKTVEESVRYGRDVDDYFYANINGIYESVKYANGSMSRELRRFAKESGIKELMRVSNIIADNISKGVELNEKLERESELLWILRKKNCEERGKMAETKLTLPLMMLLMVLIVITVAPALIEL